MGIFSEPRLGWILATTAIILCCRILSGSKRITRNGSSLRKPPHTLPLVGNGIFFLQARQKLFAWFVKCEHIFGYETFQISVPTLPPGVVINDPRNLEFVFKNERVFGKGDLFKRLSWDLFGHGIINVDGELWKAQRKAGLNFLNTSNLRVLTETALPQYIKRSIALLSTKADAADIDLQSVFHEITSQLMGKMAYDMEMHADDEFTKSFDYASKITTERFQNPLWFYTEIFTGSKFRKALTIVKSYGKQIVRKAMESQRKSTVREHGAFTSNDGLEEVSGSLIQALLSSLGSEQLVVDAALNYLSAGRDTVAQGLTWTFYLLMRHPTVAQGIREETQLRLQEYHGTTPNGWNPAALTVTAMPYTMAVFYEALRLFPPIPFEIKQCEEATTLPDGTFLPQQSIVLWCTWAMNRSKISWGDDADQFIPERWLSDGKLVTKSASEFPVFNGGPRTCLGKKMAESIAVQVIGSMLWLFDFMPVDESERVSKSSLTLPMEGGLPVYVKLRS